MFSLFSPSFKPPAPLYCEKLARSTVSRQHTLNIEGQRQALKMHSTTPTTTQYCYGRKKEKEEEERVYSKIQFFWNGLKLFYKDIQVLTSTNANQ